MNHYHKKPQREPLVLVIKDSRDAKQDYTLPRSIAEHMFWQGKLKLISVQYSAGLQYVEVQS